MPFIFRFFEMKTEYREAQKCMNLTATYDDNQSAIEEGVTYPLHFVNSSVACFNYTLPELTITELRKNPLYISVSSEMVTVENREMAQGS